MSGNFIEDLVAATKRHGVTCVVLSGNGAAPAAGGAVAVDDDEVEVVPTFAAPTGGGADPAELDKLRTQVQKLTGELQEAQKRPPQTGNATAGATTQVPAGDYGSADGLSTETLGFEDESLTKKLMRMGYETVGKLRVGFSDAKLAEAGLKKDWLIEVGMKLAGAAPSGSAQPATAPAAGGAVAGDVPAGHTDRPWMERLSLAKAKQGDVDTLRAELVAKQAEAKKYTDKKKDIPEALDDAVVELEDKIALIESQLVAMRWCMGLDPAPDITLDEALKRANLGPWMANPQPRVAP